MHFLSRLILCLQVSVFSKDLREAAEVGTGTNIVGNYELHDLVQIELVSIWHTSSNLTDSLL